MRILEELIENTNTKTPVQQKPQMKKYTQSELDNMMYPLNSLHIAIIKNNKKQDKALVQHLYANWFMDINSGKYYKKESYTVAEKSDRYCIVTSSPFAYSCADIIKDSKVSPNATMPAWWIKNLFDEYNQSLSTR